MIKYTIKPIRFYKRCMKMKKYQIINITTKNIILYRQIKVLKVKNGKQITKTLCKNKNENIKVFLETEQELKRIVLKPNSCINIYPNSLYPLYWQDQDAIELIPFTYSHCKIKFIEEKPEENEVIEEKPEENEVIEEVIEEEPAENEVKTEFQKSIKDINQEIHSINKMIENIKTNHLIN